MASLIGLPKSAWKQRPSGIVTVDENHWSCKGTHYALIPHEGVVLKNRNVKNSVAIGIGVSSWDKGVLSHSGALNASVLSIENPPWIGLTRGSILTGIQISIPFGSSSLATVSSLQSLEAAIGNHGTVIYAGPSVSGTYTNELAVIAIFVSAAVRVEFGIVNPDYTLLNDLQPHYVLFCIGDGANRAYVDGKRATVVFGTGSASTTGYFTNHPANRQWFGVSKGSDYAFSYAQKFPLWRLWDNTTFSDAEGCELTANPYSFIKPRRPRFVSIPSSGPVTFQPAWARPRSLIIGSGV